MNLSDIPDALEPVYPINEVGQPITLYEGSVEVVQEDKTITVDSVYYYFSAVFL